MQQQTPHGADTPQLRLVFWETTTACNLKCVHCRASAVDSRRPEELTLEQSIDLLRQISSLGSPVVVLSGGEPLARPDIFDIASEGSRLGLRIALATNGTTVDGKTAARLVESGVQRVSVSIDGADPHSHDSFRGVPGAFDQAIRGIEALKAAGLPVQINTSVARHNVRELPAVLDLAVSLGAAALHLFLLVPTGCGKEIAETEMISPQEYEDVLNWLCDQSGRAPLNVKATCAPHYYRIIRQRAKSAGSVVTPQTHGLDAVTTGCLAGSGVCFVSYKGDVYPCGYFPVSAGSVLSTPLDRIWRESELFAELRDESLLEGKCGCCEFARVCGGCRARAYAETGNYLAEEPYCVYVPGSRSGRRQPPVGTRLPDEFGHGCQGNRGEGPG